VNGLHMSRISQQAVDGFSRERRWNGMMVSSCIDLIYMDDTIKASAQKVILGVALSFVVLYIHLYSPTW